jgi:DNA-binding protein
MVVAPIVTRNVSNAWHVAMKAHGAPIAIAMPTVNLVERLVIDHGLSVQAANAANRLRGRTQSSNDGKRADNHNCQPTH